MEFQEKASDMAIDFIQTYDERLTKDATVLICTFTFHNMNPFDDIKDGFYDYNELIEAVYHNWINNK